MSADRQGDIIRYHCRRRWPGPAGAASTAVIEIGAPYQPAELTGFDHFLTARWVLFSVAGSRRHLAFAQHQSWPLQRARPIDVRDGLMTAAGLPPADGPPLAHYSPGVKVRIGLPQSDPA